MLKKCVSAKPDAEQVIRADCPPAVAETFQNVARTDTNAEGMSLTAL